MPSDKLKQRSKKQFVKFMAGSVEKTIRVQILPHEVIEIDFDDIRSTKTKKNLLTLKYMYNIEWNKVIRYPVFNRFGYILYGVLGRQGIPVTYVRKEVNSQQSGSTDMWFDKGYMIPALKLIQSHEFWNKKILYWSKSIDEKAVRMWHKLVHDEKVFISWQISNYIHGHDQLREFRLRDRRMLETSLMEHFTSIAKKLDSNQLMELIAILQKIQFEKL